MRGGGRFVDLIFLKYPNRHENEIIWPNYFIFLLYLITGGGGEGVRANPPNLLWCPPLRFTKSRGLATLVLVFKTKRFVLI